jgi:hypothetical protein
MEQISVGILFIVGLIGGVKYLKTEIINFFDKLLDSKFQTTNGKIDNVAKELRNLDVQTTRNFLVRYLADTERGQYLYDTEKEQFWKEYDHYIDDLKENSFIKKWVEHLEDQGKLER